MVDQISLVDLPANSGAVAALTKRHDQSQEAQMPTKISELLKQCDATRIRVAKPEIDSGAASFRDVTDRNKDER